MNKKLAVVPQSTSNMKASTGAVSGLPPMLTRYAAASLKPSFIMVKSGVMAAYWEPVSVAKKELLGSCFVLGD